MQMEDSGNNQTACVYVCMYVCT